MSDVKKIFLAALFAGIGGALVSVLLPQASPILAHANLVRAEPAPNTVLAQPPDRVVIWFTEPLEPGFSKIQVLDAQGDPVDNGDSSVGPNAPSAMSVTLGGLANGTYTVGWRNVSTVDGHRVRGSFFFLLVNPSVNPWFPPKINNPFSSSPVPLGTGATLAGVAWRVCSGRRSVL